MASPRVNLPAKLIRPRFTGLLPRSRLFRLLDLRRKQPIVWVAGLPGSGKSALVSSYWEARRLKGIWYRFDPGDCDPAGFFYHFGLAFQAAAHRRRHPLPLLTPEYRGDLPTYARNYFRDFFSRVKAPFFLVFDDCHTVSEAGLLCELIPTGLTEMVPGFTVVFVSRNDPPPSFASLVVKASLQIIDPEALRLTEEESIRVARRAFPSLTAAEARALHLQSGGWAAGLVLLAEERAQTHRSVSGLQSILSPRTFDYFAREIFVTMKPQVQELLMRTAFLPEVTVDMAQRLTQQPEAAVILSDLYRRRYFVEQQAPGSYRYHDLFREFLCAQAARRYPPDELRSIQIETAKLLAEAGRVAEAIELYRELKDWQTVVGLIYAAAASMISEGRSQTVEGWIRELPEETMNGDPWLLYWRGVCRQPFDVNESRTFFERAFEHFSASDPAGKLLAWVGVVDSIWLAQDELAQLDPWIDWLDNFEAHSDPYPNSIVEAQVVAAMIDALSFRRPNHPLLHRWVDRALIAARNSDPNLKIRIWFSVAYFSLWRGIFSRVRELSEQMATIAGSPNASPLVILTWKITDALYHWLEVSPDKALAITREALSISKKHGVHLHDPWFHSVAAHASLSKGDLQAAEIALSEMRAFCQHSSRLNTAHFHYIASRHAIANGEIARAVDHAKEAMRLAQEAGAPSQIGIFRIAMAHASLEQGDEETMRLHLREMDQAGSQIQSPLFQYNSGLLKAYWAFRLEDFETGFQDLRHALSIGRGRETLALVWWLPPLLSQLCVKALDAGIEVESVRRLIRMGSLAPDPPPMKSGLWPWPIRISTLGRFTLLIDDRPIQSSGKAQKKPLELLKALVAFGGRKIDEAILTEALWPHAEADAAQVSLKTTVHRLRKLLALEEAILHQEGALSLNPKLCWVDLWEFKSLLGKADSIFKEPKRCQTEVDPALNKIHDQILSLYQGHFLEQETKLTWTISPRGQMQKLFLNHLIRMGCRWEEVGSSEEAIRCYNQGLQIDPLTEVLYQHLMRCYLRLERRAEALAVYQHCRNLLSTVLGISPSPQTEAIYQKVFTSSKNNSL